MNAVTSSEVSHITASFRLKKKWCWVVCTRGHLFVVAMLITIFRGVGFMLMVLKGA